MSPFTESIVEDAGLGRLASLGYAVKHGPEIAPEELLAERAHFGQALAGLRPSFQAGLQREELSYSGT